MLSEESASSACPPLRTLPEDLVESGSIRVLRLLVRLMRDPVLQRSADALGVSAPTASRLLARARQWFKDPLFIYSAGRMHPTPRMLALSPRIEEELLRLESLFKPEEPFNPATVVRTLRIAAIDNAFHTLLMPFLETAATAAPGLSISVFDRAPTLLEDMRAGTLDLAFYSTEGRPVPSDFCEETLFTSGHVLLMRRGHPLHQKWLAGSEITEADTGAWPHISVVVPMAGGSDRLTMSRHPAHGPERTACETPFFVAAAMLAARTDMLMRIPQETAAELCRTLPLAMMPMEAGIHIPWIPCLFRHRAADYDPLITWVRAQLVSHARRLHAETLRLIEEDFKKRGQQVR